LCLQGKEKRGGRKLRAKDIAIKKERSRSVAATITPAGKGDKRKEKRLSAALAAGNREKGWDESPAKGGEGKRHPDTVQKEKEKPACRSAYSIVSKPALRRKKKKKKHPALRLRVKSKPARPREGEKKRKNRRYGRRLPPGREEKKRNPPGGKKGNAPVRGGKRR